MTTGIRADALTVSVALCTRNGAAYVAEQVRSILTQTPAPAEIVVGDDASSDDTLAIVERTVAEHGGGVALRILRNDPPLGVVGNFAATMEATTGDLVALSDQDDVWMPGKLAAIVARFAADPDLLVVHSDARLVDGAGAPLGMALLEALEATAGERAGLERGDAFAVLLRRNLVTGATTVFRRRLLDAAAPFPPDWVHDEWLAVLGAALGGLRLDPAPLIDYRQHGANQIGARKLDWGTRWARLREPRTARNERLLRRARSLVDRLEALGEQLDAGHLRAAREKLAHEEVRAALPASHLRRVVPVLREWRSGRYRHYGLGTQDVLRDLVQPV